MKSLTAENELVCKNRGTLLIYGGCGEQLPSYSNFFFPNFLPQIPEEMWPRPYCPGAFFGHSSSKWSFSIQVYLLNLIINIFVKTGMVMMKKSGVTCRPPSLSFSNLFFRLTFDFLPRWPPRCLNTYPASRRWNHHHHRRRHHQITPLFSAKKYKWLSS